MGLWLHNNIITSPTFVFFRRINQLRRTETTIRPQQQHLLFLYCFLRYTPLCTHAPILPQFCSRGMNRGLLDGHKGIEEIHVFGCFLNGLQDSCKLHLLFYRLFFHLVQLKMCGQTIFLCHYFKKHMCSETLGDQV